MTLAEVRHHLNLHPELPLRLVLPDGGLIPAHFHITEVGHVLKNFIDCGGTRRSSESCLLQTWVADDIEHRLLAGRLASILDLAGDVLPHAELPVEIEYEDDLIAQFPVVDASVSDGMLQFQLGWKHTDCLAKDKCLPESGCCVGASCC